MYIIRYDPVHDPDSLMEVFARNGDIEYCFPNFLCTTLAVTPNDPLYSQQRWLANLEMTNVWDITRGSESVKVAVIDGFFYEHSDFEPGPPLVPDDIYDEEKDFVNFSGNFFSYPQNGQYYWPLDGWDYQTYDDEAVETQVLTNWPETADHGTAVSGIIAARTDNGIGVAGMCWNVHLIAMRLWVPVEVSSAPQGFHGGTNIMRYEDFLYALRWIINDGGSKRADIVNMSFGWDRDAQSLLRSWWSPAERIMNTWFRRGVENGVTWVAAAGNYRNDNPQPMPFPPCSAFPASSEYVISVGGVRLEDTAPGIGINLSCIGEVPQDLDVCAYNAEILTTKLNAGTGAFIYSDFSGTSAATPMVTAACALLKSIRPDLDPEGQRAILGRTAVKVGDPLDYWISYAPYGSWAPWYGYGRLDVKAAIELADSYVDVTVRNVLEGSPTSNGSVNVNSSSHTSPYSTNSTHKAAATIISRTELLPFASQYVIGEADQKFLQWEDVIGGQQSQYPFYNLFHTILPLEATTSNANFRYTSNTDIQARLDGATSFEIEKYFKDPFHYYQSQSGWRHDNVFQREDGQLHLVNQTGTDGGVIRDVPQEFNPLHEPYYALQYARALLDVGGGYEMRQEITSPNEGDVFLQAIRKSTSSLLEVGTPAVSPEGYETTPLKFKGQGSEFALWYKGHMSSMGEQSPTARPSQRKVAFDPQTGEYWCVYASNGDIYLTISTDDGRTWSKEVLLSPGDGLAADPAIAVCESGTFAVFNHDARTIEIVQAAQGIITPMVSISHSGGVMAVPSITTAQLASDDYLIVAWETPNQLEYYIGWAMEPSMRNSTGVLRVGAYEFGVQLQPRFASLCGYGSDFGAAWTEGGWLHHRTGKLSIGQGGNIQVAMRNLEIVHDKWHMPVSIWGGPSLTRDRTGNYLCTYEGVNTWSPMGFTLIGGGLPLVRPNVLYVRARNYRGSWQTIGQAVGTMRSQNSPLTPSIGYADPGAGYGNYAGTRVPFNYDDQTINVVAFEPGGISLRSQTGNGSSFPSITDHVPQGESLLELYSVAANRLGFDFNVRSTQTALNKTKEYTLFQSRELAVVQDTSFVSLGICTVRLEHASGEILDLHWDEQRDTTLLEGVTDLCHWFTTDTLQAAVGDRLRFHAEGFRRGESVTSDLLFHIQVRRAADCSLVADSLLTLEAFPTDSARLISRSYTLDAVEGEAVYMTVSLSGEVSADNIWINRRYLDITDMEILKHAPSAPVRIPQRISIRMYPNPTSDEVRIVCETHGQRLDNLVLYDALGRTVQHIAAGDGSAGTTIHQLNTRSLQPGVYYVVAITGDQRNVAPLVVVR